MYAVAAAVPADITAATSDTTDEESTAAQHSLTNALSVLLHVCKSNTIRVPDVLRYGLERDNCDGLGPDGCDLTILARSQPKRSSYGCRTHQISPSSLRAQGDSTLIPESRQPEGCFPWPAPFCPIRSR